MSVRESYRPGEFCWVDLMAHDMTAVQPFYNDLLGWECVLQDTHGGPPYGIFQNDGRGVAGLGQMDEQIKAQGAPPTWNNYIHVDDIEQTAARVTELGGQIAMPVMKVLDAGWMAVAQDPTGAFFSLWQKGSHFGAELVNQVGAFCWNELATRDIDAAAAFYRDLLGWDYQDTPNPRTRYLSIRNQGRLNGGLMQMTEEWGEVPSNWTVYFSVTDADAAVAQTQLSGGKVYVEPFEIPVGRMAVVADPQGATFCVIKLSVPPD